MQAQDEASQQAHTVAHQEATEAGAFGVAVATMRQAFDQSFLEPAALTKEAGELVLAIRAGGERHAVRLSELAGVHECPKIVPLPGANPACLGLIGLRGRFHGVFRLSTLLGGSGAQTRAPWILIAPGRDAPAFAVEAIEGCFEMEEAALHPLSKGAQSSQYVRGLFVREETARGLLDLPALVATVMRAATTRDVSRP